MVHSHNEALDTADLKSRRTTLNGHFELRLNTDIQYMYISKEQYTVHCPFDIVYFPAYLVAISTSAYVK